MAAARGQITGISGKSPKVKKNWKKLKALDRIYQILIKKDEWIKSIILIKIISSNIK